MEQSLDKSMLTYADKKLLEDALKKNVNSLSGEEIGVIRARRVYLNSVEREVFKEILEEQVLQTPEAPKAPQVPEEENVAVDYSKLTNAKLLEILAEKGIVVPETATIKADYLALLDGTYQAPEEE